MKVSGEKTGTIMGEECGLLDEKNDNDEGFIQAKRGR